MRELTEDNLVLLPALVVTEVFPAWKKSLTPFDCALIEVHCPLLCVTVDWLRFTPSVRALMEVYSVCQCPSGHWRKFTDPDNALIAVYCLSVNWWKLTLVVRVLAEVCSVHMCTGRIVTLPAHKLVESYRAPASVLTKVYSIYPCSGESFILFVSALKKVGFDCPEFF